VQGVVPPQVQKYLAIFTFVNVILIVKWHTVLCLKKGMQQQAPESLK